MLADLCSSGHPGKVGTLAFIQYTCLFNPHPAIRPTRKGPAGSKPVMTWIGLSGNQPAIHWMLDKTQPSLPNNILHLKAFHPYCKRPECEKIKTVQQKEAQGLVLCHRVTKVHDCPSCWRQPRETAESSALQWLFIWFWQKLWPWVRLVYLCCL